MVQLKKNIILALTGLAVLPLVIACNGGPNKTNIELITDMMDQQSAKPQDWDPENPEQPTMRVPPEGTVPRNFTPMKYASDAFAAGQNLKNPMAGDNSPQVIELGKRNYEIYCKVCHGDTGAGDGPFGNYDIILKPKSLLSDTAKSFPDGRLFHIIVMGQGLMGGYGTQIRDDQARWALVNYVRNLQKNSGHHASK